MSTKQERKQQEKRRLIDVFTPSANPKSISVIETVVNRFTKLPAETKKSSTISYNTLSDTQKAVLHAAIKNSMKDSSLTASGQREKAGMVDALTQTPESATQALEQSYTFMQKMAEAGVPFNKEILLELHRLALPHLPKQNAGIRIHGMGLPNAFFIHQDQIQPLLRNLMEFMNNPPSDMNWSTIEAIAQGIFLSIHPFRDGNGRISKLLVTYMSMLHRQIPSVFPPILNHVVFAEVSPDGIKNAENILAFKEVGESGVVPTSLSIACMQQLKQGGARVPTHWNMLEDSETGKRRGYILDDLHATRAKKIREKIEQGRQTALDVIQGVGPSLTTISEDKSSVKSKAQLIEYFLETPSVLSSVSGRKQKAKIIANLAAQGVRTQPGVISLAVASQLSNLLTKAIPTFFQAPTLENSAKLNTLINHLNFLRKCILANQLLLTLQDRKYLFTFHQEVQGFFPQLASQLADATAPEAVGTLHAIKNLVKMCVTLGCDKPPTLLQEKQTQEEQVQAEQTGIDGTCYPSKLFKLIAEKTGQCEADIDTTANVHPDDAKSTPQLIDTSILPRPIEILQTSGASRSTPFSLWDLFRRTATPSKPQKPASVVASYAMQPDGSKLVTTPESTVQVFPKPTSDTSISTSTHQPPPRSTGDTFATDSCRPVEYKDEPSVYCEGENNTMVYTPKLPEPPFAHVDSNLMFWRVLAHGVYQLAKGLSDRIDRTMVQSPTTDSEPEAITVRDEKAIARRIHRIGNRLTALETQLTNYNSKERQSLAVSLTTQRDMLNDIVTTQPIDERALTALDQDVDILGDEFCEQLTQTVAIPPPVTTQSSSNFFLPPAKITPVQNSVTPQGKLPGSEDIVVVPDSLS